MSSIIFTLSENRKNIYLRFDYFKPLIELIKSLGTCNWRDPWWVFRADNRTLLLVCNSLLGANYTLTFEGEIQKLYDKALKWEEQWIEQIQRIEEIKRNGHLINVDFSSFLKIQPYDFQKAGFAFLQERNGCAIVADEMGLGKSMQALAYTAYNKLTTLVICPASLKENWRCEIEKFTWKSCYIPVSGVDLPKEHFDYLIINYEMLVSKKKPKDGRKKSTLEQLLALVKKEKINCVVCDEAHRIKNPTAKATKVIHKEFKKIPHRILLTGTPIKSRPIEYFSLLKFIDPIRWNNRSEYAMRYCGATKTRWGYDFSGASNLQELYKETTPYVIRREKSEVLKELPDKIYTTVPILFDEQQQKQYEKLEDDFVNTLELEEDAQSDEEIKEVRKKNMSSLSKVHALRMYTSDLKIKYAIELIESIIEAGQKVIVFSQYLKIIAALHKHFGEKSVTLTGSLSGQQRQENVIRFQTHESCKVFIGSIGAAGVGITLVASSTVIFLDLPWTSGDFDQCSDRAHRIGQKNAVSIITLSCENSIDERVRNLLAEKRVILNQVLNGRQGDDRIESSNIYKDLLLGYLGDKKRKKRAKTVAVSV